MSAVLQSVTSVAPRNVAATRGFQIGELLPVVDRGIAAIQPVQPLASLTSAYTTASHVPDWHLRARGMASVLTGVNRFLAAAPLHRVTPEVRLAKRLQVAVKHDVHQIRAAVPFFMRELSALTAIVPWAPTRVAHDMLVDQWIQERSAMHYLGTQLCLAEVLSNLPVLSGIHERDIGAPSVSVGAFVEQAHALRALIGDARREANHRVRMERLGRLRHDGHALLKVAGAFQAVQATDSLATDLLGIRDVMRESFFGTYTPRVLHVVTWFGEGGR